MKKTAIYYFFIGVSAILLVVFGVFPLVKEIRKNKEEILLLSKDYSSFESKNKDFLELKETYNTFKSDIDKLFINKDEPIEIIKFWEKTASDCNLEVKIAAGNYKEKETEPWNYIDFQISIKGKFADFMRFLEKAERSPYINQITNLSVEKEQKEQEISEKPEEVLPKDIINSNFIIRVFSQ